MLFRRPLFRRWVKVRKVASAPYILLRRAFRRRSRLPVCRLEHGVQAHICRPNQLVLKEPSRGPPANAAGMQGKLRAGDHSFLDRLRHFGGGSLRGGDTYWADRSGAGAAWLHCRVEKGGGGSPTLSLRGVSPISAGPSFAIESTIAFISPLWGSVDRRAGATRRYQAVQDYPLLAQEFFQ